MGYAEQTRQPGTPVMATDLPAPHDGDLIIAPDPKVPRAYTVAVSSGLPQERYPDYDEAVEAARRWTARTGVRVWAAMSGPTYRCLDLPERTGAGGRAARRLDESQP